MRRTAAASRSSASPCRSATRTRPSRWASAWCTSTSCWSTRLSALENVLLGAEAHALLHRAEAAMRGKLDALMQSTGLKVALDAKVADLPVGDRQRLEILKALGARREDPDPGRTHRGAHAAGNAIAVRGAGAAGGAGHDPPADHPQAQGGDAAVPRKSPSCAPAAWCTRRRWPTPRWPRWPRRWSAARWPSAARRGPTRQAARCGLKPPGCAVAMRWA